LKPVLPDGKEVDGNLFGRQVIAKGILSVVLSTAFALPAPVVIIVGLKSETYPQSFKYSLESDEVNRTRSFLIASPSSLDLVVGEKGVSRLRIEATSTTALPGYSYDVTNSIDACIRVYESIKESSYSYVDKFFGDSNVSATGFTAVSKIGRLPETSLVDIDVYYSTNRFRNALEEIVRDATDITNTTVNYTIKDRKPLVRYSLKDAEAVRYIDILKDTITIFKKVLSGLNTPGYVFRCMGKPVIVNGCGNPENIGLPNERISVDEMKVFAEILKRYAEINDKEYI